MKLAEALARRADIQTRINELNNRTIQSARHQEGEEPSENVVAMIEQVRTLIDELEALIRRINRVNSSTSFEGRTITDAIARRDALALRRRIFAGVADAASARRDRITRSEVKYVTSLDVTSLRREADDAARAHRELDVRLQEANWMTEMPDE